jgi:predicted transcriptional regulator
MRCDFALENSKMKKKISTMLSSNVLARVDQLAGSKHSRSVVIERAIRSYWRQQARTVAEVDELELINNAADQLNIEVADVLEYVSAFAH